MRLALIAATAALLGALPGSPTVMLPDGTYRYAVRIGGTQVGASVIVVRRSGSNVTVIESGNLGGRSLTSTRILDSKTFATATYDAEVPDAKFSVSISGNNAKLVASTKSRTISTPAGAPFVVNENMVAGFATIPALVTLTGVRKMTLACVCTGAFVAVPVEVTAARAGTLTVSLQSQTATLRYDPLTGVLREFDLPSQDFSITLESRDASTAVPKAPVAATPLPLPQEQYTSRDVTVTADDGVKLAGTLTLPSSKPPFAAVLLVHGSGCIDRDETIGPNKIFLQIANHLSNAGYAVLRYDKRSCGKSGGTFAVRDRLIADARDALAFLRAQPEVDGARIYVLGHSEGGELAPSIAIADGHLRGIVLLAPPALPLEQVLLQQLLRNVAPSRQAKVRATARRAFVAIESGKRNSPGDRWLRSSFRIDPAELIARVPCPILVIQGTKDIQVLAADTPRLVSAARAAHRDVTVAMLDGDDHLFIKLPPNDNSTGGEYFVPSYLDDRLFTAIQQWLASH